MVKRNTVSTSWAKPSLTTSATMFMLFSSMNTISAERMELMRPKLPAVK